LLAPGLGQFEDSAPAVGLHGADETLILELLEGGIHGSGARPPGAVAPPLELLDDLVAVRRLLCEEHEDGGAHVPSGGATAVAEVRPHTSRAGESLGELGGVEWWPAAPVTAAGGVLEGVAD